MARGLTPRRRRGVEELDDPGVPEAVRQRAMSDLARSNRYFGGTRAVLGAIREVLADLPDGALVCDVGTGTGDIAVAVRTTLRPVRRLECVGVDVSEAVLRTAWAAGIPSVTADALRLPFGDRSVDLVVCSQLLHHFEQDPAQRLIRELHRIARRWVVIADLRRSWVAAAGFYAAATGLHFHRITRDDGVTSVLRGFTSDELTRTIVAATGIMPTVRRRPLWRLVASWPVRRSTP